MFDKILIANRGEIACRVATTARRLGVRTVAVYSDADAGAKHVALCDEAVRVGPAPARDSYLRADAILAATRATGAQAVHPGYGFLSENESFARACAGAGVVFIGPPPDAIRAMGSKSAAKALMERAPVPLVPGYHGDRQEPAFLRTEAERIGFPVLIKASAGGGGKGMRIVRAASDFDAALASCQREAAASFGDDRVLVEKYLERPRHIEIQVFADTFGACVSLFERDCSVQRRHQKVIEEAPAPRLTAELRRAMGDAAVSAARAVNYVGAGTVEFIASADVERDGVFYFMEMNTRLQVEHPVTEMVTGFDLVEWQLRVAAGEPLPVEPAKLAALSPRGHAIEARIYAENPDKGFLPAIGRLSHLALPPHVAFARNANHESAHDPAHDPAPVRIDSGVRAGDAISPHYDPMIAKLIVWGHDRAQALARLCDALARLHIVGLANNVDFLTRLANDDSFVSGDLDTGLIERRRDSLFPSRTAPSIDVLALACARVLADDAAAAASSARGAWWRDPWGDRSGWRLNGTYTRHLQFKMDDLVLTVALDYGRHYFAVRHNDAAATMTFAAVNDSGLTVRLDDRTLSADVVRDDDDLHIFVDGRHRVLTLLDAIAHAGEHVSAEGGVAAPMPGKVIALSVAPGTRVKQGTTLLVMEAMKMEHTLVAPADGVVNEFFYAVGDQVAEGAPLLKFDPAS